MSSFDRRKDENDQAYITRITAGIVLATMLHLYKEGDYNPCAVAAAGALYSVNIVVHPDRIVAREGHNDKLTILKRGVDYHEITIPEEGLTFKKKVSILSAMIALAALEPTARIQVEIGEERYRVHNGDVARTTVPLRIIWPLDRGR